MAPATIARTLSPPALADAALAAAWITLVIDGIRQSRRQFLGPHAQRWSPSVVAGVGSVLVTLAGAMVLERLTIRFTFRPLLAALGVVLLIAGVALHGWARRTLGASWSPGLVVPRAEALVTRGPYAWVRHPIYAAALLLAAGTPLAHPSPASVCIALGMTAGIVAKAWREERALRMALGPEYTRYAARVPALVPRMTTVWRVVSKG